MNCDHPQYFSVRTKQIINRGTKSHCSLVPMTQLLELPRSPREDYIPCSLLPHSCAGDVSSYGYRMLKEWFHADRAVYLQDGKTTAVRWTSQITKCPFALRWWPCCMGFMTIAVLSRQMTCCSMLFFNNCSWQFHSLPIHFHITVHSSPQQSTAVLPVSAILPGIIGLASTDLSSWSWKGACPEAIPHGSKPSAVRLQWQKWTRSMEKYP